MALALSFVANVVIGGLYIDSVTDIWGLFKSLHLSSLRPQPQNKPAEPKEMTVIILQDLVKPSPPTASVPAVILSNQPKFARTSDDQLSAEPEAAAFIGERNTRATSSRVPIQSAPALPSQGGVPPRNPDHIETVESTYKDGALSPNASATPSPTQPSPPAPQENTTTNSQKPPGPDQPASKPPAKMILAQGPNPVDVSIAKNSTDEAATKSQAPELPKTASAPAPSKSLPKAPVIRTSTPPKSPGFKGYQRKTAIVGSISRTGRSALDVVDSPLGRYQAIISRAVELEWQRNCMRHRDFITPGFLTVRFFVETTGHVRTVQFVGEMETGEVQKGFTLNAIRDAEIPKMPSELKKEFEKEPLELIFNFYF